MPIEDFLVLPPFKVRMSAKQICPSDRFLVMSRLEAVTIRRSEDCYVDELFGAAFAFGAQILTAHFPRAYLDVYREPWELDPRIFAEPVPPFVNVRSERVVGGLGTVPKLVCEGLDIYAGRLPLAEVVGRIECVYKSYHEVLKRLVMRKHARFGYAMIVDCHSMPASIRLGDNGVRPDFIVGDRFGTFSASVLFERTISLLTAIG